MPASLAHVSRTRQRLKQSAERLLTGRLGDLWEHRESRRKIRQLSAEAACASSYATAFTPQRCKGHMDDHGDHVRLAYAERLERLGLDPQEAWARQDDLTPL